MKTAGKEPKLHWHKSNRDDCFMWTAWWNCRTLLSIEASNKAHGLWHLYLSLFEEERDACLGLAGFGKAFYLSLGRLLPSSITYRKYKKPGHYQWTDKKFLYEPKHRETGLRILSTGSIDWLSDWYFNVEILHDSNDFSHSRWKGISFNLNPANWVLGRFENQWDNLVFVESEIELPEASYPVTIKVQKVTIKRTRYWKQKVFLRADVDIKEGGTPIPTGQQKFGSDNDRYGSGFPVGDPDKQEYLDKSKNWLVDYALNKFKTGIIEDRKKYDYQAPAPQQP